LGSPNQTFEVLDPPRLQGVLSHSGYSGFFQIKPG
jgi:hypothetical protein